MGPAPALAPVAGPGFGAPAWSAFGSGVGAATSGCGGAKARANPALANPSPETSKIPSAKTLSPERLINEATLPLPGEPPAPPLDTLLGPPLERNNIDSLSQRDQDGCNNTSCKQLGRLFRLGGYPPAFSESYTKRIVTGWLNRGLSMRVVT